MDSPFHSFVTTCFVCVRGSSSCRSLCTRRLGNGGVHQLAGQLGIPRPRTPACAPIRSKNHIWNHNYCSTTRDAMISPAEVIARCRLAKRELGDCRLMAYAKPLSLAVGEAGGQLRLSRRTTEVEGPCGVFDGLKLLKRTNRGDIALTTRTKQPSYTRIRF